MEKGIRHFDYKTHFHEPLFRANIRGEKREALGKVLAAGYGSRALRAGSMKPYEFKHFMDHLEDHEDLKAAGWNEHDFKKAHSLLEEHFVAQANDTEPPAEEEEAA